MFKKLRIKFILLNMISIVLVLVVAFATICGAYQIINTQQVYSKLETALRGTSTNSDVIGDLGKSAASGQTPDTSQGGETGAAPEGGQANGANEEQAAPKNEQDSSSNSAQAGSYQKPDSQESGPAENNSNEIYPIDNEADSALFLSEIGVQEPQKAFIPVAVYKIDYSGAITLESERSSVSLSESSVSTVSRILLDAPEGQGSIPSLNLIFVKRTYGGVCYAALADTNNIPSWTHLASILLIIGLVVFFVFFIISLFFSKWALRPVSQAWTKQRQFIADASHDLKTPLTVILANNTILLDHPEKTVGSQSQWVESTQHEAVHMQAMIEDMLVLAQLDEKPAPCAAIEEFDFSDMVESKVLQYESVAFENGLTLESEVEEGIMLKASVSRFERLVSTLIDNACKYAGTDGAIEISLSKQGNQAKLSVNNTGMCIPSKDLEHIFDRFYRVDKVRTSDSGGESHGHGLGLAIAKAIVEEAGGTISATSSPNQGTTFYALIPLARKE